MQIVLELEKHLNDRDVSLYEFCKVADISYQQGLDLVNKRTKSVSFSTLEKICLSLNCQINELLVFEERATGYLHYILTEFPDTGNVKRLPQTKVEDKAKPFLQWVGGKREMIRQYRPYFPTQYKRYVEPMLGGGALFFHLSPVSSVINDNNPELVRTYEAVRDKPEEVIELLQLMRRKHSKELYMAMRSVDRKLNILNDLRDYEIAARMIYLNQTCFNGVYRVNKNGQFNVPIGSSLNRVICDPESIRKASTALKDTQMLCKDFEETLQQAETGDFIYLDPPYEPVSQYSDFTRYTKEKFYRTDQIRLAESFKKLNKKGCKLMLSNSSAPLIKELYKSFNVITVQSGRNLNSKADKRGKVEELLITNY